MNRHCSKDGVRAYKEISEEQEIELSEILQSFKKSKRDLHVEPENKKMIPLYLERTLATSLVVMSYLTTRPHVFALVVLPNS